MTDDALRLEEKRLFQQLADMQAQTAERVKPIIDRLIAIQNMRAPKQVVIINPKGDASTDAEVGGTCNVCGGGLRYGERHRKCGDAIMVTRKEQCAPQQVIIIDSKGDMQWPSDVV